MGESAAIFEAIPHRPPFLFVDEIVELTADRIVARKHVDGSSGFFRGHYPDEPIMPGVLICECCFQAGAILISKREGGWNPQRGTPVLARISDARFRRIVRPGDTLDIEATCDDHVDNAYYCTGQASVAGESVLRVQFVCMLTKTGEAK